MAPHSSTHAWKIPWMEEPVRLQSMGPPRVGHDWATSLSCIGEENGNPLQCSCLENPRDGGAWWAAIYGVAQSRTRLKWLSSSSSMFIAALLTITKRWKQPNNSSMDEWINKMSHIHTCSGILFNLRKDWSSDRCYNINEPWRQRVGL